jgi:UDPglucose 6-dehydrogenase
MNVSVIGTGYVGLSTGVCLAEIGHQVTCIDIDKSKIEMLNKGISPIYEPGLERFLQKNIKARRLSFTTCYEEGLIGSDIIFMTIGTPQGPEGKPDLSYLERAAVDIASHLNEDTIIVIKSTVPVGTNNHIKEIIDKHIADDIKVDIVSNPEFLREGSAIVDTLKADRIVLGSNKPSAIGKVKDLYSTLNIPILETDISSAEMIKYASNAFLALKISYINEIANLCELVGADVMDVAKGMGMDRRIGESFLRPGIGYGGSCFPKDVLALQHSARDAGMTFDLLSETMHINNLQQLLLIEKAKNRFGELKHKNFAVLGLAFKPGTDDIREAPSIPIIQELIKSEAYVATFDPAASNNMEQIINHDNVNYCTSLYEAVENADALFIITEWDEIISMDLFQVLSLMKQPVIFDGRNCLKEEQLLECEKIEYYPVGRPNLLRRS